MILIDVHTHLDFYKDNELDKVIENARKANVKVIIANGVNRKSNEKTLKIAEKYKDIVKIALGMYPTDKHNVDEDLDFIRKNKDKIIALGEVGMDFKDNKTEKEIERQKQMFGKIIDLGKELEIPLIVHSRKAEKKTVDFLLEKDAKKIVLHFFCGKKQWIPRCLEKGWYFSIPTNVVRSEQMQSLVRHLPMNRILTETDSPYISPYPDKEKNEPAFVVESLKKIAEIKKLNKEEVGNNIYKNYQTLFL